MDGRNESDPPAEHQRPGSDPGVNGRDVLRWSVLEAKDDPDRRVREVMISPVALAYPAEILRTVAGRVADQGLGVLPVVDRVDATHLDGLVTQFVLLEARQQKLDEERHAERVLTFQRAAPSGLPRSGRVAEIDRD